MENTVFSSNLVHFCKNFFGQKRSFSVNFATAKKFRGGQFRRRHSNASHATQRTQCFYPFVLAVALLASAAFVRLLRTFCVFCRGVWALQTQRLWPIAVSKISDRENNRSYSKYRTLHCFKSKPNI